MQETFEAQTRASRIDALGSLVNTCNVLDAAFFDSARRCLQLLLANEDLLAGIPVPEASSCSRTLLSRDPMNRFGIWALWWPPGSETPVHNHHCSCAFGVYRGRIEEIVYDCGAGAAAAVERQRSIRPVGFIGGGSRDQQAIHRMRNADDVMAVSIHLYAYHPDRHDNSIERSFETLPRFTSA